jgi:hypothetical protein
MKPFRRLMTAAAGAVLATGQAVADTQASGSAVPPGSFLLQSVALLIVIACVLAAFKFYTSIKGGRVARGWMWVFCGFLVFAGAQMLLFAGQLGVLPLFEMWVDALKVVSLLLFFVGINQLRKIMA